MTTTHALVHGVRISNPQRVIDARSGVTKLELAQYHERVAPQLVPQLKARPVAVLRAPEGVGHEMFFQKHLGRLKIAKARELDPELDAPNPPLFTLDNPTALVGAVQMGVVEIHTWNALATSIEKPDRVVFDLDPGDGLPWARVVEAAELVKNLLDELGLRSFLKTSGGRGLHIVLPLQRRRHDWEPTRRFAQAVTLHLAEAMPDRFAAKMGAENRVGKVFVDWLRNNRGATVAAAWSVRARPGLGVSVPLAWEELVELQGGDHWTLRSVARRLDETAGHDPWAGYEGARQGLAEAIRTLMAERPASGDEQDRLSPRA